MKYAVVLLILIASVLLIIWSIQPFSQENEQYESKNVRTELPEVVRLNPAFQSWVTKWRAVTGPEFSAAEFSLQNTQEIDWQVLEGPQPNIDPNSNEARRYVFSPDNEKFINYFACYGEPDSCVNGYNLQGNRQFFRLLFCGTLCGYHEAIWIDNTRFIILGRTLDYFERDDANCEDMSRLQTCNQRLTIDLYDLAANSRSLFISQPHLLPEDPFIKRNNEIFYRSLPDEEKSDWRFLIDA